MSVKLNLSTFPRLEGSTAEMQRIYLIRHGQSELNLADADGVQRAQGTSLHVPLTAHGEDQAKRLFEKLIPKIEHLDLELISSNALRAQQTIKVFAQHFKQDVKEYPGLRELGSGEWEGQRKEEAYLKAYKVWKDLSPKEKFTTPKMPGGESPIEVVNRAVKDLDRAVEVANGKTVLGVCHDMTSNALTIFLNRLTLSEEPGKEPPYIDIANCDIIMIEVPTGKSVAEEGRVTTLIKTEV